LRDRDAVGTTGRWLGPPLRRAPIDLRDEPLLRASLGIPGVAIARIGAVGLQPPGARVGELELDTLRHKARREGKDLELTSREYALLDYLMRHADRVVTRTMLAEHVWEHDPNPTILVQSIRLA